MAPVLTQALDMHYILKEENYKTDKRVISIFINNFLIKIVSKLQASLEFESQLHT